jgi:transglutaminase-like putative cysteine protease
MKTRISLWLIMMFVLFTPLYAFADYVGDCYMDATNLSTQGYAEFIVSNSTYDNRWKVECPNGKIQYWPNVNYSHEYGARRRIYFTGGTGTYIITPQYLEDDGYWVNHDTIFGCIQTFNLSPYLYPAPYVESKGTQGWNSFYNTIPDAANTLSIGLSTDTQKATAFYEWVYANITYDYDEADALGGQYFDLCYPWHGAEYSYIWRTGICHDKAALFIGLCRAKGIPTKGIFGKYIHSDGTFGYHDWAEVYLNGSWVKVDPTNHKWGSQITPAQYQFIKEATYMN